jgi:hypothetical protein
MLGKYKQLLKGIVVEQKCRPLPGGQLTTIVLSGHPLFTTTSHQACLHLSQVFNFFISSHTNPLFTYNYTEQHKRITEIEKGKIEQ